MFPTLTFELNLDMFDMGHDHRLPRLKSRGHRSRVSKDANAFGLTSILDVIVDLTITGRVPVCRKVPTKFSTSTELTE